MLSVRYLYVICTLSVRYLYVICTLSILGVLRPHRIFLASHTLQMRTNPRQETGGKSKRTRLSSTQESRRRFPGKGNRRVRQEFVKRRAFDSVRPCGERWYVLLVLIPDCAEGPFADVPSSVRPSTYLTQWRAFCLATSEKKQRIRVHRE